MLHSPTKGSSKLGAASSDPDVSRSESTNMNIRKRQRHLSQDWRDELLTFKTEITHLLTQWKSDQQNTLERICSDMTHLKGEIMSIKKCNSEIEKSLEFVTKKYEEIDEKINYFEKNKNELNYEITLLKQQIEDMERKSYLNKIEICNVPKRDNENLFVLMRRMYENLDIEYHSDSILNVYRTRGRNNRPGSILVELSSPLLRDRMLQAYRKTKLSPGTRVDSSKIGIDGPKTQIFISEQLTKKANHLFFLARSLAKTKQYKYCWTRNGNVYLRKEDGSPFIIIKDENHITKLQA